MSAARINANLPLNRTVSVLRASGAFLARNTTGVPIYTPSSMSQDSQSLTDAVIGGTGQIGLVAGYAVSPNALGAPDEIRKLIEENVADKIPDGKAGTNYKNADTLLQTSGYTMTRTGAWIGPTGNVVAPLPTNSLSYGSDTDVANARLDGGDYHTRIGLTNSKLELPERTQ